MFGFKFSPDHIQSLRDGCPSSWELASKTMRIFVVRLSWRKTAWCDELTIEELQEILNEEHPETQRNVSPSEQEEDERGPMPTSAIKDLLKKREAVRAMVLEWHLNQADVSRVGDLYNDNAINYFRKILKKREKQSTLDMFFNAP
ncbi:uncharacterized protein TNCV_1206421 [Trichonephila clavipes]|nr:uncharacterized protein TNCV_1206421 [Trichonephila clavipes]